MSKYKFEDQEVVHFDLSGGICGTGLVVGVSTTSLPVLGPIYMVKVVQTFNGNCIPNEEYPYSTISVPECCLEPIGKYFEGIL